MSSNVCFSPKAWVFALTFLFSIVIYNPAWATCAPTGSIGTTASTTSSSLSRAVTTMSTNLVKDITTAQTKLTLRLELMKQQVTMALTGISTAISSTTETKITANAKAFDALATLENEAAKRTQIAQIALDNQPSASGCIQATGRQHMLEGIELSDAASKAIAKEFSNIYTGVGGGLSVSNSDNTIGFQADMFRFLMANFCNPDSNGGLVPTSANPIETTNGPVWCGMDRAAGDEALVDLHLEMPGFLLEPSKLIDHPKARQGVIVSMLMMLGMPLDKASLPDLQTAAGQAAYVQRMAQGTRMMIPATYLSQKFGERFPTMNNEASAWAREILKYSKGRDIPPAIEQLIDENYSGNVSQSQFLEAMVGYVAGGSQYGFDTLAMTEGQYNQEVLNLMALLNYLKSKRLKESEVTNTLSAAIYAAGIGG